jgi:SAM-dependent methyltransferase
LESRFKTIPQIDYLTADLHDPLAMEVMDVTRIEHPDQSFDVIFCSHVLEHVEDDRRAMREFHRTLRDGGWAILLVPITADRTVEDPSVTDPEERKRLFGQADHLRRYGPDYVERLWEAGFSVSVRCVPDILTAEERAEYGIPDGVGPMYLCSKSQRS